jgi:hypothetical protein
MEAPTVGRLYRHFKGGVYCVRAVAECASGRQGAGVVVYSRQPGNGTTWYRPVAEWNETVTGEDGVARLRFTPIDERNPDEPC